jgi:large subunit ribosomal protein L6
LKFGNIMSRIGKQIITIPANTEVSKTESVITVKGPKGELKREFKDVVAFNIGDQEITLEPVGKDKLAQALWGTYASHLSNMIQGVNEPFAKKLIVEGVGYRAEMKGKDLVLNVGYSHPVEIKAPEGIELSVEKSEITVSGINKEDVGRISAEIRAVRKPEPYKGKGIRYIDEVIRRKEGKKNV